MFAYVTSRRRLQSFVGFALFLLFASSQASGQTAASAASSVGHGSAGGGVFIDLSGDDARLGSHDGVVGPLWFVYGSVFVAQRVALGVELATLGSQEAATGVSQHSEAASAIYGVIRVRAVQSTRLNLDVVGGLGRQNAHSDYTVTSSASGAALLQVVNDYNYWMYALGADAPISVAPHFVVSPFARVYLLSGWPQSPQALSREFTAFAVGVTAGVKW